MCPAIATIKIEGITKTYPILDGFRKKEKRVLDGVSLDINPGETYGLMGSSGSGKSTLGRILTRLIPAGQGSFYYDDIDMLGLDEKDFHSYRKKIQILFQHPESSLNPYMKIIDCLREPYRLYDLPNKENRDDYIRQHIKLFGIEEELLNRFPSQVSGGQIQRIVLARLMLLEPDFIVLDEPTSMLDVSVQAGIMHFLLELQKQKGISYLLISHDLDLICRCSHNMGVLHDGQIVEEGIPERIISNPEHTYTKKLIKHFYSV